MEEHERWNYEPAFVPRPGEHGMPENLDEVDPATIRLESICGGVDDSQPVEQYDGTLGVTRAFVDAHQTPVGQLQWNADLASKYADPGNVAGVRWCSGTLISEDLFLTAGHCFDREGGGWRRPKVDGADGVISSEEIATNMHVNFNFQVDPQGDLRQEQSFPVLELVENRLGGLDYAVVRLGGNPGSAFGWTRLSERDARDGEMLCIIGHPAGLPKRIEAGPVTHLHDDRVGYNSIDTLGGNSGSGILLSPEGTLVGVHTNGGCDAAMIGHNHGYRISSLRASSPTIRRFAPGRGGLWDAIVAFFRRLFPF